MTALYGYHDKDTGKRIIALALRNKDAALLGLSGPESGDIIYFLAEHKEGDRHLLSAYSMSGMLLKPVTLLCTL